MSLVPSIKVEGREVAVASPYDAKFVEAKPSHEDDSPVQPPT